MTIADILRDEVRLKGKTEGLMEGKKEIALKLLQKGADIDYIIELTDLSAQEIQKLKLGIAPITQ